MSATDGTTPIPLDNSAAVSFTPSAPAPQTASQYGTLESGYTTAINSQPTVQSMTSTANSQFGVPQLQGEVSNDQATEDKLNTQIANVGKTVGQASQQSIMTDGQKTAAEQNLTTPLQTQLSTATTDESRANTNLNTAQSNASQQVAAGSAQETKQLLPWTQSFSDEAVIAAQNETNFTTANANQLSVLLANQSAGVTLTQDEQDNMEKLSQAEDQFASALAVANVNANAPQLISGTDVGVYSNGQATTGSAWS